MDDSNGSDICRVCRSEGLPDRPLFHPCICTGSIKWIHQECLMQWMQYSRKEYCELCSHKFSFTPIYSPDMPRHLPLRDVAGGLLSSIITAVKYWLHYSLVAVAWLGIVPLTACRTYRCLFSGSVESIITLPLDMLTTQNIPSDFFHGCFVITCTLFAFMGMVWLKEQIIHGGGPDWLERDQAHQQGGQDQPIQENQQNGGVLDNPIEAPIVEGNSQRNSNSNINNNNLSENDSTNNENNNNSNTNSNSNSNANNINNHCSSSNSINQNDDNDDINVDIYSNNNNTHHHDDYDDSNDDDDDNDEKHNINGNDDTDGNNNDNSDVNYHVDNDNNNFVHVDVDNDNDNIDGGDTDDGDGNGNDGGINSYSNIEDDNHNNWTNNNLPEPVEVFQEIPEQPEENVPNERDRLLPIPLVPGPVEEGDPEAAENAQDEGNWNPIEWDRAVEELTWERILGLDGSLVFLRHVFWVVSLSILFIVVFAFCPYHFGNFIIIGLGLREKTLGTHFEGLITTLCGYCIIGFCLVILHSLASLLNFQKSRRVLGLCYVIVKVSLLSVVEIGVLPLICGWWLDICSLAMFDATLKDRETSFKLAPGTSMFIHWLVGIIYVYYFVSFILLLREVLRPGVFWFLINLNDPDFSPIQELIHLPVINHIQRLLVSSVVFGTAVLLMFWLPVKILRIVWPSFLPYTVVLQSETQVNELSLELLLFQIILPALLDQSHPRTWMKSVIRLWCKSVSWLLGIHSYLLGDEEGVNPNSERAENNENIREDLGGLDRNQVLLPQDGPIGFQPYHRPSWFYARMFGLIVALFTSLIVASLIALTIPVWIGRKFMTVWLIGAPTSPSPVTAPPGSAAGEDIPMRVHELYTAACGSYICWLIARAVTLLKSWLPEGRAAILQKLKQWFILGLKSVVAFSVLLGVIPLLFGILLELVILVPLRVPLEQTPVLFIWQDWALGVLYTKIACAIILMGPNWSMQRAIERVYRDGIRNMDLLFILYDIATPVVASFGLALAIPYVTAHGVIPLVITNLHLKNLFVRRLYPFLLLALLGVGVIIFQIRQFKKLYEHIKNDKYLVGKRLVNYDHRKSQKSASLVQ